MDKTQDQLLLEEVGEALYGSRWQRDMSRAINISDRHLRRYISGEFTPPDHFWDSLKELCSSQIDDLKVIRDKLKRKTARRKRFRQLVG